MIEFIEMEPSGFSIEEATGYLNHEVVRKGEDRKGKSIVETHGIVVGLLVMNDELELVVKWSEGIQQYMKSEFFKKLEVVDD